MSTVDVSVMMFAFWTKECLQKELGVEGVFSDAKSFLLSNVLR
jgi:hypothetical protein